MVTCKHKLCCAPKDINICPPAVADCIDCRAGSHTSAAALPTHPYHSIHLLALSCNADPDWSGNLLLSICWQLCDNRHTPRQVDLALPA